MTNLQQMANEASNIAMTSKTDAFAVSKQRELPPLTTAIQGHVISECVMFFSQKGHGNS